ncbi:MAG: SPOR domain-containing protein [Catalinimonas sp.]
MSVKTLLLSLCLLAACKVPQKSPQPAVYTFKDDLSPYRPEVTAPDDAPDETTITAPPITGGTPPTNHLNEEIDGLIQQVRDRNAGIRQGQGFRIQVYTGTDREAATNAKARVYRLLPEVRVYTTYQQPTFRVQAGDFLDRLEAQKAYAQIKGAFPAALLINDEVNLPKRGG